MEALDMALIVQKHIIKLQALKEIPPWQTMAERKLVRELSNLFNKAGSETVNQLRAKGLSLDRKILTDSFGQLEEYVAGATFESVEEAAERGRQVVINELGERVNPFPDRTLNKIKEHTFEASKRTVERIRGDVMENLAQSQSEGLGIDEAGARLNEVFDNLAGYEARRIARTEINSAQNIGAHETMLEKRVQYEQWWTADDSDVRDGTEGPADHMEMHGQIIRTENLFSNGLRYPGDRDGGEATISEWINCRCRVVPFLMPEGYTAPDQDYFYEGDLIPLVEEVKEDEDFEDEYGVDRETLEKELGKQEADQFIKNLDEGMEMYDADKDVNMVLIQQEDLMNIKQIDDKIFSKAEKALHKGSFTEWVGSSLNPRALAMDDVIRELGLTGGNTAKVAGRMPGASLSEEGLKKAIRRGFSEAQRRTAKKMVLKEYVKTQRIMKARGMNEVKLYRGIDVDAPEAVKKVMRKGIESWTDDMEQAEMFGDLIMERVVHRKQMFSTAYSNVDVLAMGEQEYITMSEKLVNNVDHIGEGLAVLKGKETIVTGFGFEIFLRLKSRLGRTPTKEEIDKEIERVYQKGW